METTAIAEGRLQAEIDALRAQHPDTQDLYREVCVVLFFRHGVTPTANKLYQLVRKGSMSAPAEALNRFWETLREKSRIRIEHPDLPEALRNAAGEMVGALWQHAQTEAHNALKTLQEASEAQVQAATNAAEEAIDMLASTKTTLDSARVEALGLKGQIAELQANLARAQGEVAVLQRQIDTGTDQRRELQASLNATQQRFTHELEQQRTTAVATQERHDSESRRLLLEIDRERTNAAKVLKELDLSRRALVELAEKNRTQLSEEQNHGQLLGQRNAELAGAVTELRRQRDQLHGEAENLRLRLERRPSAKRVRSKSTMPKPISMGDESGRKKQSLG